MRGGLEAVLNPCLYACHRLKLESSQLNKRHKQAEVKSGCKQTGRSSIPRKKTRIRIPRRRNLRRNALRMGLRSFGNRTQRQHKTPVVENHGHNAPRRCRSRHLRNPAHKRMGSLRTRKRIQRPAYRMSLMPQAAPRRHNAGSIRTQARTHAAKQRRHALSRLRNKRTVDRTARLQHDAANPFRTRRRRKLATLPATRNRAGNLRRLQKRSRIVKTKTAVRNRKHRQKFQKRNNARKLHLPHARIRTDGNGILRQTRRRRTMAPVLDRRPHALVHGLGNQPTSNTKKKNSRTIRSEPSTSNTSSASKAPTGENSKESQTAQTSTLKRTQKNPAKT